MLQVDGSQGEGGGQILRSSLLLSLITGKPFCITRIRAGRRRPGLLRQHLTAVQAATAVGQAQVEGAGLGSSQVTFIPGAVRAGKYAFAVGTAGSTSLVLQTVLPALALADGESTVELRGGTHNPMAPPFDFLAQAYLPLVRSMGPRIEATLHRPGFYPAGGGHAVFHVVPARKLTPVVLMERGEIGRTAVVATVAGIAESVGAREVAAAAAHLGWPPETGSVVCVPGAHGPGNVVSVMVQSQHVTEVFTAFGEKGTRAEAVAQAAAQEAGAYLKAGVPVGPHLADQLLLWVALAGAGGFRTTEPTPHTRTHCDVIELFLERKIHCTRRPDHTWTVTA